MKEDVHSHFLQQDAVAVEIQATFVLESGGTKLRQAEMQLDSSVLRDASGVIDYKHMETSPDTLALQVSTDLAPQMSLPPAVLNMESASTPKITPKKRKQASEVVVVERPAKKQKGWAPKGLKYFALFELCNKAICRRF